MAVETTSSAPAGAKKWLDRAVLLLAMLLLIAVCYLLVKGLFLLFDKNLAAQPPQLYAVQSLAVAKDSGVAATDPSLIPQWHLFGKQGVKQVAEQPKQDVNAPETSLQLELHGVFVAEEEKQSTAIISEARKESRLYYIGDPVPGNATLDAVFADRVLLNRQGRLEALYFPKVAQSGVNISRSRSAQYSPPRSYDDYEAQQPRRVSGRVEQLMQTSSSASAFARSIQSELGADPEGALEDMGLQSNSGRGYRVSEAGNPMFAAIGARPGDVILSINGRQLGNPTGDFDRIEELLSDCNASFTMERNGVTFTNKLSLCP